MIVSFRHKGLQRLFIKDDGSKLPAEMHDKIRLILSVLHAAEDIGGVDVVGFRLHTLKGDMKGLFAVTVRANWRIVFRFESGKAFDVDFMDYH